MKNINAIFFLRKIMLVNYITVNYFTFFSFISNFNRNFAS